MSDDDDSDNYNDNDSDIIIIMIMIVIIIMIMIMIMMMKVVRTSDRTVGLTLTLEPNTGEVGRSSFPSAQPVDSLKVNLVF